MAFIDKGCFYDWFLMPYLGKAKKQNTGLYTPLPVPHTLWHDLRMNFVLRLPKTTRGHDAILVVEVGFLK